MDLHLKIGLIMKTTVPMFSFQSVCEGVSKDKHGNPIDRTSFVCSQSLKSPSCPTPRSSPSTPTIQSGSLLMLPTIHTLWQPCNGGIRSRAQWGISGRVKPELPGQEPLRGGLLANPSMLRAPRLGPPRRPWLPMASPTSLLTWPPTPLSQLSQAHHSFCERGVLDCCSV